MRRWRVSPGSTKVSTPGIEPGLSRPQRSPGLFHKTSEKTWSVPQDLGKELVNYKPTKFVQKTTQNIDTNIVFL